MSQSMEAFEGAAAFPPDNASSFTTDSTRLEATMSPSVAFFHTSRLTYVGVCFLLFLVLLRAFRGGKKLPAGVKRLPRLPGLPWAGRFWDVPGPGIEAAFHFGGLHKKHGPIYEWKVMGTTHIWIETDKVARDLFVKRQKNYCDRNALPAAVGVKEAGELLPLAAYSEDFRRHKNFIHSIQRHAVPKAFYGWPVVENRRTLLRLMETPDRWSEHMITHCARTIASIAWGNPEHGKKLLTVVPDLLKAVSPDGPIVNKLTFLQNLPAAVSPFKQYEARRKQLMQDAFYEALADAQERTANGSLQEECWAKLWVEHEKAVDNINLDHHEAAFAIGSAAFVAIATIGGPLHAFFLALCHYPSWLPKLQEEIDRVCGDRLPSVEDMPQLPRLRATVAEVLRWRQSTPLGVPHEALQDDVYDGYFIPKGAMLHANHYLISREESIYPKGNEFLPERWLDPSYPTYREPLTEFPNLRGHIAFGYGNRSCPGVDLTNMELCTLFGALAWSFDIKPREGYRGPLPWYEVNPYVITMSKSFPVDITVRSEEKRDFIRDTCPGGDSGYTLVTEKKTRWDVLHEKDGKPWTWQGLALHYEPPATPKIYPPGV